MDKIYLDILNSIDLEQDYKKISNPKLKSFYSFFIATMFYYKLIDLSGAFACTVYTDILNIKDEINYDKIIDYVKEKDNEQYMNQVELEIKQFEEGNFGDL